MKKRRVTVISSLFIALIAFFAVLTALAAAVPDFKWEGVDSDSGRWEFSWQTVNGEYWATVQYETNPDTWTTLSNLQWARKGNRTHVTSPALSNDPSGQTFTFRAKVKGCNQAEGDGVCLSRSTYGWTELEVEFDD